MLRAVELVLGEDGAVQIVAVMLVHVHRGRLIFFPVVESTVSRTNSLTAWQ